MSTYAFTTLDKTLPHNLNKEKLTDLIESTFQRKGSSYLVFNDRNAFFTFDDPNGLNFGLVKTFVTQYHTI